MRDINKLVVVDEYGGEYFINEAYRPIAEQLKRKFSAELQAAPINNILFVDRQETKLQRNGRTVCAQISSIPTRWQELIYQFTGKQFAFMIELFRFNITHMTREQIVALLYHELRHIQLVVNKGSTSVKLVGHHVEDWTEMIEKLGVDWNDCSRSIPDLLDDSITRWDDTEGPFSLFTDANLRLVK